MVVTGPVGRVHGGLDVGELGAIGVIYVEADIAGRLLVGIGHNRVGPLAAYHRCDTQLAAVDVGFDPVYPEAHPRHVGGRHQSVDERVEESVEDLRRQLGALSPVHGPPDAAIGVRQVPWCGGTLGRVELVYRLVPMVEPQRVHRHAEALPVVGQVHKSDGVEDGGQRIGAEGLVYQVAQALPAVPGRPVGYPDADPDGQVDLVAEDVPVPSRLSKGVPRVAEPLPGWVPEAQTVVVLPLGHREDLDGVADAGRARQRTHGDQVLAKGEA